MSRHCCSSVERWLPAPGYDDTHEVSSIGRVRRTSAARGTFAGRMLVGRRNSSGYPSVHLKNKHGYKWVVVHRLVLAAFGSLQEGFQTNHKDFDREHNCIENLEAVTPRENTRHAAAAGHMARQQRYQGPRQTRQKGRLHPYKGISLTHWGRWKAYSSWGKHPQTIGYFDDPVSAARAYDAEAIAFFGREAITNFPCDVSCGVTE